MNEKERKPVSPQLEEFINSLPQEAGGDMQNVAEELLLRLSKADGETRRMKSLLLDISKAALQMV